MFDNKVSDTVLIAVLLVWGIAGGIVLPSLINMTLKAVPSQFVGIASGVYNTIQQAASSIGICIIGGLFFAAIEENGSLIGAFHYSLYISVLCLSAVFVLLLLMDDIKR